MTQIFYAIAIYSCIGGAECQWTDPIPTPAITANGCAAMAPQVVARWWAAHRQREVAKFRCGPSEVAV